jgi:hypothetical protein
MKLTHILKNRSALAAIAVVGMALHAHAQLEGQLGILDLTANGGNNPATGAAWQAGDQYRIVFTSSTTTQATSTDIATYDAFVQGLADAASLGGT